MSRTPDSPVVSVVIPAYNAAWCVGKAIDSVLAQDFKDFEILVVNDGSTDDTASVLAAYGQAIRVIEQVNGGLSNARNTGIHAARGEFIAYLDADDWWLPNKLGSQVDFMRKNPSVGFCSTAARVEDPEGNLVNTWACPQWDGAYLTHVFRENAATAGSGTTVMVQRGVQLRVGNFDESLRSLEDIDMWIRLAAVTEYACVAEPLAVILKRPGSMSRNLEVMREAALRVMNKNRDALPAAARGGFWRACMANVHADYAKWRYREGQKAGALLEIAHLFRLAPLKRARLGLGLLKDIILGRPL